MGSGGLSGKPGSAGGPGSGTYEDVKGQIENSKEGYITKSSSLVGKEGSIYVSGTTKGAPDEPGSSSVPYYEVYGDYKKSAEKALSREDVPSTHRQGVRKYFDSLNKE
jgi:hypothetical protein